MSSEDGNSSISSLDYHTGSSNSSSSCTTNQKKGQNQLSAQQLQANLLSKNSSASTGISTPTNRRKSSITYSHLQNAALSTVIAATGSSASNNNGGVHLSSSSSSSTAAIIKDHHHDDKSTGKSSKCGGGVGYDCIPSPSRFSIGAASQTQQQDSAGGLIGFHLGNRSLSIHPDRYDDGITSCCLPPPSPAPSSDRFIMGIPSPVSSTSSSQSQQQQQQQQHYQDLKFSVHHRSMSPSSR